MCIEAYVEWQLPFHFSDHWFNPDRATAGHGAALSACLGSSTLPLCLSVCVCVCVYSHICLCTYNKMTQSKCRCAHLCICLCQNVPVFCVCVCLCVFVYVCVCARERGCKSARECSASRKMCCTGWLQWQANAAFNEGGGVRRGKHRKLNWYVNDGNSHLSWRLRVLQH